MLDSTRAANTACKYSNGWQRWKTRVQSKLGVPVLPAVPLQVALYQTELVERAVPVGHSASAIESASISIRWGHCLAGMGSPTIYPWRALSRVLEGAKQPLKHDSIAEFTLSLNSASASASLAVIRFLLVLVFFFEGGGMQVFFVLVKSWAIECGMFPFFISRRFIWLCVRTISTGTGHVSVIDYWSRKPTCPAGITERISSLLPDPSGSSYPIVCSIVNSGHSTERFHKSLV